VTHALGEVVIIGGGCYGSFYLGQLLKARDAGAVTWQRVLVVDRDPGCAVAAVRAERVELCETTWDGFLDHWLDRDHRTPDDRLVPSPLMPHLMAEWMLRRARRRYGDDRVQMVPAREPAGTPFDQLHPADGVRYLSHADWTCPVHCIEPATCPVIRAPRQWEMSETVTAWAVAHRAERATSGPVLFTCRHLTHGVGMYPVVQAFAGLDDLEALVQRAGQGDLVIGSISACHGAMGVLRVGPPPVQAM
jgi:hypothetical protein